MSNLMLMLIAIWITTIGLWWEMYSLRKWMEKQTEKDN
jgi:hypothetical protein